MARDADGRYAVLVVAWPDFRSVRLVGCRRETARLSYLQGHSSIVGIVIATNRTHH